MTIAIPAHRETITMYKALLAEKGVAPEELTELRSRHANRTVAGLVIMQQALAAAGMPVSVEFIEVPNAARERMMVRDGEAVISGQDLFSKAITDDVYMSSPVIPKGAFVKGVYTLLKSPLLQGVPSLDELRQYSAASCTAWKVDQLTLEQLDLKKLRSVPKHELMYGLLADRKVDFILLEFPATDDLSIQYGGLVLQPVPGVKIGLVDSRHFAVSKKHPDGPKVYHALEKGLEILRRKGVIDKFYTDVGFYNPAVADWTLLNP